VGDKPGYVSMDAPLGRAMMGKQLDDDIAVSSPAGRVRYSIAEIRYTMPA
jgi:transcription elongation factor GreB